MKITTNNQARPLITWIELLPGEREQFDYLPEDERYTDRFVRYKGVTYDVFDSIYAGQQFPGWHGYLPDSFFSGVVFRLVDDAVICGTYITD